MYTIRATIRDGRVEPVDPLGLPEGADVLVIAPDPAGTHEGAWDDSPEGIVAWLRWYDALEPLVFTADERRAWDQAREERKRWDLAHADAHAARLRDMWS